MSTRAELLGAIRERYRAAPVPEKRRILDEFVAGAGYHRKHAIRLLGQCRGPELGSLEGSGMVTSYARC